MRKEFRERILAFKRIAAERKDKASDLDIIVSTFAELPPGQLKKVLTDDVIAVLKKYGVEIE